MNIEELREYCLSVKGSGESFPFDDTVLVFKIMGKMFAYISIVPKDDDFKVNLKCDAEHSMELREHYSGVTPGHYANSMLWNAVSLDKDIPDGVILRLVDHSVDEVVKKLPKFKREE